jgi:hypothetical protein
LVYRRLFDNILHLGTGAVTVYFGSVDNPAWYDAPRLAEADLVRLGAVDQARHSAEPTLRYRVDLSLRWLAYAARDRDVDAFLKYWIAIETLAMPDGTNVRPANELLARTYGLTLSEVVARFCLGRIQGVRSAIVHRGSRVPIPGELTKFLEAIYFDLIAAVLSVPSPRRAFQLERQGSWELTRWVAEAASA